nr:hypothetical protein [Tanacetum cinerariifolium]
LGLYQVTGLEEKVLMFTLKEETNFEGDPPNNHLWFVPEDNWIGKWMKRKEARTKKESQICYGQFISKLAMKCRVLTYDVVRSLSAPIYCRDLDTTTFKDLIDSDGKLIPEDPHSGVPRFGIPRPPRASMEDLYDRMGRINILQEAIEHMEEPITRLAMLSCIMTSTISSINLHHHSISSSRMMTSSVETRIRIISSYWARGEGFNVYFEGGLCSDEHFNAQDYWLSISREKHLGSSRSHTSTIRKPILRVIHQMITYGLRQRTTGYDKIHKNNLWLLSMFDARHQNGYANVDWEMDEKERSENSEREDLDTTTLKDLIDSDGKLIPEDPHPGMPRVGIPRPPRASMEDLYDMMGRIKILQEAIEHMEYRQSYH